MTGAQRSEVLARLREEHYEILMGLNNARNEGLGTPEGRSELLRIQDLLFDHLAREDGQILALFAGEAEADPQLRALLEAIPQGTRALKEDLELFFKTLPATGGRDFDALYRRIKRRILREENILFQELD